MRERLLVVWGPVTVLTSDQPGRTATPSRTNSFVSGYLTEKLIDSLAREQLCIYVEGHLSDLCHGNIDSELHFYPLISLPVCFPISPLCLRVSSSEPLRLSLVTPLPPWFGFYCCSSTSWIIGGFSWSLSRLLKQQQKACQLRVCHTLQVSVFPGHILM